MIKKTLIIVLFLTSIQPCVFARSLLAANQAAFIRDNDLWTKIDGTEEQITVGEYIRYPKWSQDGYWIAYLKGTKDAEYDTFFNGDLWLYNIRMRKHFKIKANASNNFAWSPKGNQLTFLVNNNLFLFNPDPSSFFLAAPIASKVENFSWFPDGKKLLISSRKSTSLHSDITLSEVSFDSKLAKPQIKPLYTIPVGADEYYVSTSSFKWSHDRSWVSFLLIPTASLSADSNTLCLLSLDGREFTQVDEMLNDENWFQWSPMNNQLGYIYGPGREAQRNKQLRMIAVPGLHKKTLTPMGFVERDFIWKNSDSFYVSRSVESELVEVDRRPLPSIYEVNNKQRQVSFPLKKEGDFAPQIVRNQLVWIRTDRKTARVFVSRLNGTAGKEWINYLTVPSWYYEKWHWDEVVDLYVGCGTRRF